MSKGDRLSGERWKAADTGQLAGGGSLEASASDSSAFGLDETSDAAKSENSDLSADYDLRVGTESANTSGVSDVVELSWSSEADLSSSAGAQPKEDIRKLTAQLKAQWWQNNPGAGDPTVLKMTPEISGRFNPRISPNEPYYDSRLEGKLEQRGLVNSVCGEDSNSFERKSDDLDEKPETTDAKPEMMDAHPNNLEDISLDADVSGPDAAKTNIKDTDIVSSGDMDCDKVDAITDVGFTGETLKTDVDFDADFTCDNDTNDVDDDKPPANDVSHEVIGGKAEEISGDGRNTDVGKLGVDVEDGDRLSARSDVSEVKEDRVKSEEVEVPKSGRGKQLSKVNVEVAVDETMATSPTSPAPPTRPKPLKSPPVRPPPFVTPGEVRSETCPPPVLRKPSADRKPSKPDSPGETSVSVTSPSSTDGPKTRTLDRVRPEKPPPPLPKTSRSRTSDPVVESAALAADMDCSDNAVFSEDIAAHDEDTHL